MDYCSVPNCKFPSKTKFQSPINTKQLNLWKEILNISEDKFLVCDQHFEDRFVKTQKIGVTSDAYPSLHLSDFGVDSYDICQCCMKSLKYGLYTQNEGIVSITNKFREVFKSLTECELPPGTICRKCHDIVKDFVKFRETVKRNHSIRNQILNDEPESSSSSAVTFKSDCTSEISTDKATELEVFNVLKVNLEKPKNKVLDATEICSEILIKEEKRNEIVELIDEPENKIIIKVEPTDDEEVINSVESITNSESEESSDCNLKISNPRSLLDTNAVKKIRDALNKSYTPKMIRSHVPKSPSQVQIVQKPPDTEAASLNIKCQHCSDRFLTQSEIAAHISQKHDFRCAICSASFPYRIVLLQHHVSGHKTGEEKVPTRFNIACSFCEKKFRLNTDLVAHIRRQHLAEGEELIDEDFENKPKEKLMHGIDQIVEHAKKAEILSSRIKRTYKPASTKFESKKRKVNDSEDEACFQIKKEPTDANI